MSEIALDASITPVAAPHGRRLAEMSLGLAAFAIGLGEFAIMGVLPDVAADLDKSVPQASALISAYALGVTIGAPFITILCARVARHRMMLALITLYALANALTVVAPTFASVVLLRFISGLPHGAFLGLAALAAASMARPSERASSIGRVFAGLTLATILGVPVATWCAHVAGWRSAYVLAALIAGLAGVLMARVLPKLPAAGDASPLTELSAFTNLQIWLTLGTGAIGFGGLFAVYSYIAPALVAEAHASTSTVSLALAVIGIGMFLGTTLGAGLVDRAPRRAIILLLLWDAAASASFAFTVHSAWATILSGGLIGFGIALAPALQTRLMLFARSAQSLAAAMNHSAFNVANALGAWLAGIAIAAGGGWGAPGWVGALLALCGLAVFLPSLALEARRSRA